MGFLSASTMDTNWNNTVNDAKYPTASGMCAWRYLIGQCSACPDGVGLHANIFPWPDKPCILFYLFIVANRVVSLKWMRGLHLCAISMNALLFWAWPYSEVNLLNMNSTHAPEEDTFWMFLQQFGLSPPLQGRFNMVEKITFSGSEKKRMMNSQCHCKKWRPDSAAW